MSSRLRIAAATSWMAAVGLGVSAGTARAQAVHGGPPRLRPPNLRLNRKSTSSTSPGGCSKTRRPTRQFRIPADRAESPSGFRAGLRLQPVCRVHHRRVRQPLEVLRRPRDDANLVGRDRDVVLVEAAGLPHLEVRCVEQQQPVALRRRQPLPVDLAGQLRAGHRHVACRQRLHEIHLRPDVRRGVVQAGEEPLRGRGIPLQPAHERAPGQRRRHRVGELRLRHLHRGERVRPGGPDVRRLQPRA